ncbi:MAG TPA: hypothetical protein VE953_18135 [Terriglobales bacterium]|nr:hypothetical protein [Terriglobales bacterium]
MQNPPPGPPPGGQPPYPPPGGQQPGYPPPSYQSTGGVDKKTGAILSYLLGWITGIIFLFVGKNDPDVKYHAAQSVVFFGGMTVIFWALRILESFLPGVISFLLALIGVVLGFYTFIMWIVCLVQANNNAGARFQIPIVGSYVTPYAEQLANAVS